MKWFRLAQAFVALLVAGFLFPLIVDAYTYLSIAGQFLGGGILVLAGSLIVEAILLFMKRNDEIV